MDVSELLEIVDEQGFDDVDVDIKVNYIQMAIDDICGAAPWPFLDGTITMDAANGTHFDQATGEMKQLTGVARAISKIVPLGTSFTQRIRWIRRDEHLDQHSQNLLETGNPSNYFMFGEKFYLFPIPSSGTFQIDYVRIHPAITSASPETDILIPARRHEAILLRTIYRLYAQDEDHESAGAFKAQYDEYILMMREDMFKKQYDTPDTIFVTDPDDFNY